MFIFKKLIILISGIGALTFLLTAVGPESTQDITPTGNPTEIPTETPPTGYPGRVTPAERPAATERIADARLETFGLRENRVLTNFPVNVKC